MEAKCVDSNAEWKVCLMTQLYLLTLRTDIVKGSSYMPATTCRPFEAGDIVYTLSPDFHGWKVYTNNIKCVLFVCIFLI